MPCNCGGGSVSAPLFRTATDGQGAAASPFEYEVTYPTGRHETFATDTEAYRAIRLTGGGVKRKPKT